MTKKEIRGKLNQDLVKFLKKHKSLCKYIDNCYKQQFTYKKGDLVLNHLYIQEISIAFQWYKTPEKYVFWNKIDDVFKQIKL